MNVHPLHPRRLEEQPPSRVTPAEPTWTNVPWMPTASGGCYHFLEPDPKALHWADIIEPMARLPRFGGHTQGAPLMMAQHSCMVAEMVPAEARGWALLSSAHTVFLGVSADPVADALTAATIRQARRRNLSPLSCVNAQREGALDLVVAAHVAICAFARIDSPTRQITDIVTMADRYVTARQVHWLLPDGPGKAAWRAADPELFALPKGKAIRPWNWEAAATMYTDALERALPDFDRGR